MYVYITYMHVHMCLPHVRLSVCLSICRSATPSFVVFLNHVLGLEAELSAGSTGVSGGGRKKGGKARQPNG